MDEGVERHAESDDDSGQNAAENLLKMCVRGKGEVVVDPAPRHDDDDRVMVPVEKDDVVLLHGEDDRVDELVKLAQVVHVERVGHCVGDARRLGGAEEGVGAFGFGDGDNVERDAHKHGERPQRQDHIVNGGGDREIGAFRRKRLEKLDKRRKY